MTRPTLVATMVYTRNRTVIRTVLDRLGNIHINTVRDIVTNGIIGENGFRYNCIRKWAWHIGGHKSITTYAVEAKIASRGSTKPEGARVTDVLKCRLNFMGW